MYAKPITKYCLHKKKGKKKLTTRQLPDPRNAKILVELLDATRITVLRRPRQVMTEIHRWRFSAAAAAAAAAAAVTSSAAACWSRTRHPGREKGMQRDEKPPQKYWNKNIYVLYLNCKMVSQNKLINYHLKRSCSFHDWHVLEAL